jgi:sugar lactone lactonase YvrE
LSFTFNPDNQKGYLLNKTEFTLQHFGIDSIERIHDEKTLDLRSLCKDKQVISYGITISKSEKLFYLTEKRNIIYGYDFEAGLKKFSDGVFQCYKQRGERKYLKIQS